MPTYRTAAATYCIQQVGIGGSGAINNVAGNIDYGGFPTPQEIPQGLLAPIWTDPQQTYVPNPTWLGALCFDELMIHNNLYDDMRPSSPFIRRVSVVAPSDIETNQFWMSRYEMVNSWGSGGDRAGAGNFFAARTKPIIWYVMPIQMFGGGGVNKVRLWYTDGSGGAEIYGGATVPATGTVALAYENNGSANVKLRASIYDGAAWVDGPLGAINIPTYATRSYVGLQIQPDNKEIRIFIGPDNGPFIEDDAARYEAATTPITNTPTHATYIYSGVNGPVIMRTAEIMVYEGAHPWDVENYHKDAEPRSRHVFAYYPNSIGDSNDWTAIGVCNVEEKWRAVRDPLYANQLVNDYIQAVGTGSDLDQLFGIDFVEADNPDAVIDGVYVSVGRGYELGSGVVPDAILMKQNGVTSVTTGLGPSTDGGWLYTWYATAPDGTAWTPAKLETTQVGVRNTTNLSTQNAHLIVVGVVGIGLSNPPILDICQPADVLPVFDLSLIGRRR